MSFVFFFILLHLYAVINAPVNPDNAIVVRNVKPSSWSGRNYSVGVIKGSKMIMTQRQVPIGDQAVFILEPILYIGVVQSDKFISAWQIFTNSEIAEMTDALASFDLRTYPNGLKVLLKESADGKFTIIGESM